MKTMMVATVTLLGIGMGVAYAGGGEGVAAGPPDTLFTELPGVSTSPPPSQAGSVAGAQNFNYPNAVATSQYGAPTGAYVTSPQTVAPATNGRGG
jgi:hypothetical protein